MLRALLDGQLHNVKELTKTQMLPQAFTYKIIKKLEKAGLVEIIRGNAGGCRLKADLGKTSLYDFIAAMEERSDLSACMDPNYQCAWQQENGSCTIRCRLAEIQETLDQELRRHSLGQILWGN